MALEEIKKLTDDGLRIRVGELLGLFVAAGSLPHYAATWSGLVCKGQDDEYYRELPHYPTDLNAMYEVEEPIWNDPTMAMKWHYATCLHKVSGHGLMYHISARHRAEAFVLMMEEEADESDETKTD